MLSDGALNYLRPLTFNSNATRLSCAIPLGGIYWSDEIPDFQALLTLPHSDRDLIFRLFSIRFTLWANDKLSEDDQAYWRNAQNLVPDYPVFHRVNIDDGDRAAQIAIEEDVIAGFGLFLGDADKSTLNNDGSFSLTFDLNKDQSKSPWRRFREWCRGI